VKRAPRGPAPEGDVRLDFEIRADQAGAADEWAQRGAWLDHVCAHGEALAVVVWDLPHENALVAPWGVARARATLRAGEVIAGSLGNDGGPRTWKRGGARRSSTAACSSSGPALVAMAINSSAVIGRMTAANMVSEAGSGPSFAM
jgi:hypothetical protein